MCTFSLCYLPPTSLGVEGRGGWGGCLGVLTDWCAVDSEIPDAMTPKAI